MKSSLPILVAIAAAGYLVSACGDDDSDPVATPRATRLLATTTPPDSVLMELDATTGAFVRVIGTVGYQVNGLEYVSASGRLLATTSTNDPNFASGLLSIDMATGAATTIGASGSLTITNLASNRAGQLYSWSEDTDDLVSLGTTGVPTVRGDSGLGTATHGLRFDAADRLWFVNEGGDAYIVDAATGVPSTVGSLGTTAHHGDFHPDTGRYWGIDVFGGGNNPRRFIVATLDPTAVVTSIPAPDDVHALTFVK